jgi:hypothetical protein
VLDVFSIFGNGLVCGESKRIGGSNGEVNIVRAIAKNIIASLQTISARER